MKTGRIVLIVLAVVFVLLLFRGCSGYNNLVSLDGQVSREWANVQNAYQRRADLIPNLVATVQGYAAHEKETLKDVVDARANATSIKIDPSNMTEEQLRRFQSIQSNLGSSLGRLIAVAEAYPDLKAAANFQTLQTQLEGTENRIAVERRKFNEVTFAYNTQIRMFPTNLFAGMFGFRPRPFFEAAENAQQVPQVDFGKSGSDESK